MPPWGELISQGGAWGIVAGIVLAIVTGRLVPRRTLRDAHEDRDRWKELALEAMAQNGSLIAGARVTHRVLEVLPDVARDPT